MARRKKDEVKTEEAASSKEIVTVKDLAEELDQDPRKVRLALRSAGYKAPEVKQEGFGPKSKYEWIKGSKEEKEVRDILDKAFAEAE